MTIRVLFWSYFRERVGAESAEVSLPEGARVDTSDAADQEVGGWS